MVNEKELNETVTRLVEKGSGIQNEFVEKILQSISIVYEPTRAAGFGDYKWGDLEPELRQEQRRIRKEYFKWKIETRQLIELIIPNDIIPFDNSGEIIETYLEFSHGRFYRNDKNQKIKEFEDEFDLQINLMSSITPIVIQRFISIYKPGEKRIS
ncbi:MAG: hypothetical protein KAS32_14680 [Candidatus Peribacteraceae bacterium]|nr:hypothetical protein [Candidatus Peribacteraceae bacterium]